MTFDATRLIFIHGLEGSSQGFKAGLLRKHYPDMLIPDFRGELNVRMATLYDALGDPAGWTIIGSSFGGLMGALFTCQRPQQVRKLVLMAPALIWPDFANTLPTPVAVPTIVYHGQRDTLIPLEIVRPLAEQVFTELTFYVVDDSHGLRATAQAIDWPRLLGDG